MALKHLLLSGWPNPVAADVTAITLGATGTSMLAAELKNGEPQQNARITSVHPHQSYIEVDFTVTTLVRALALVKHSLVPGDRLRIVGQESGSLPPVRSETIAPNAIINLSNYDGTAVSSLDEHPSSPDGTTGGPLVNQAVWSVYLTFDAPASVAATGADYQAIAIWVKLDDNPETPNDYATVHAMLYNNITEIILEDLGTKAVSSSSGQLLVFTFDATNGVPTGAGNVRLRLDFSPGITATTKTDGLLDAIAWECLYQTDKDNAHFDTEWETIEGAEPDPQWGGTAPQRATRLRSTWHQFLDPARSLGKLRVEFRADGLGTFSDFQATPPRTPNEYIDVGCLLAAPAFEAGFRFAPGAVLEWLHKYVGDQTSITGSNRRIVQWSRRQARVDLPHLSEEQALSLFERIGDTGADQAGLVSLEPGGSGKAARLGTFWATADEMEPLIYPGDGEVDGARSRGIGFRFVERL